MKRAFLILLGLAVAAQGAEWVTQGTRIFFLGDSITKQGNREGGFVNLIRQHFARQRKQWGVEVIGAGVNGNTVFDALQRISSDVFERKPNVVVAYLGINDIWNYLKKPAGAVSPERYETGIRQLVKECHSRQVRVVLCTPSVIGEVPTGGNSLDKKLDEYSEIVRKVAKESGSGLCDLRKALTEGLAAKKGRKKPRGIFTYDGVHLNDAGNRLVSEVVLTTLGETP